MSYVAGGGSYYAGSSYFGGSDAGASTGGLVASVAGVSGCEASGYVVGAGSDGLKSSSSLSSKRFAFLLMFRYLIYYEIIGPILLHAM